MKIVIYGFSRSLIKILLLDFRNSKWRIHGRKKVSGDNYAQRRWAVAGTQAIAGNSGRVDSAIWDTYLGRLHS